MILGCQADPSAAGARGHEGRRIHKIGAAWYGIDAATGLQLGSCGG